VLAVALAAMLKAIQAREDVAAAREKTLPVCISAFDARRGYKHHPALKAAVGAWFDEVKKVRWSSAAAGGRHRFRERHRVDHLDRHAPRLRQNRCDEG
jgi:hypothetical protein